MSIAEMGAGLLYICSLASCHAYHLPKFSLAVPNTRLEYMFLVAGLGLARPTKTAAAMTPRISPGTDSPCKAPL